MATIKRAAEERQKKIEKEQGWPPQRTAGSSRRKDLRRRLAAARFAEVIREALVAEIQKIEAGKLRFADEHAAEFHPLRAELTKIEAEQAAAMLRGEEPDPKAVARCLELLQRIRNANQKLTDAIAAADKTISELNQDRLKYSALGAPVIYDLESTLFNSGDPALHKHLEWLRRSGKSTDADGRTVDDIVREIIEG